MEATYNLGTDVDVCRMFDQYLYKVRLSRTDWLGRPGDAFLASGTGNHCPDFLSPDKRNENLDLSLSVSHPHVNGYNMGDQTFHTPSFGDEEFDIPAINPQQPQPDAQGGQGITYQQLHSQSSMGMSDYQQQQYQQYSSQSSYMTQGNQMMMMPQQQQQQQPQQTMMMQQQGVYLRSPTGNSPPIGHENATTSDDSDDSTPHPAMMAAMKRPSPEPVEGAGKIQKKPKVQKKKKKRDPNEPQKPVSAYALFFRDTQAAIKGQNPNASFGEVSKIVASMWDALDADSKNVYKKKTEAAKKDYLKALAIYRASIVSKGAGEGEGMYGQYGGYGGGYSGYSPPGMSSPPNPTHIPQQQQQHMQPQQQPMGNMTKKSPLLTNMMNERGQNGAQQPQQQGMMGSPMSSPMGPHMGPQAHLHNQGSGYMQQVNPSPPLQHGNVNLANSSGDDVTGPGAGLGGEAGIPANHCIRQGCTNPAITNSEWEDEYCSNECVVGHCRDVFNSWMASNRNQQQSHPAVK